MKRFRRWLFNGLAAFALVLILAIGIVWSRSYGRQIDPVTKGYRHDRVTLHLNSRNLVFVSMEGELVLSGTDNFSNRGFQAIYSYWFIVLLFSPWPIAWLVRWQMRRRTKVAGMCMNCGYDLRATPERCPECGTMRPKKEIVSN